jgi:hypothetical protein
MPGSTKIQQLRSVAYELMQLHIKTKNHIEERIAAEGYVYADTYRGWVDAYNNLIARYNRLTSADLSNKTVDDYELSSTMKTVRTDVAKTFMQNVKGLSEKIEAEIESENNKDNPVPGHQMRICFKTGTRYCPLNPPEKKSRAFVAMPFSDEYKDSYEYGVKLVLDQMGIEHFKADNEIQNKDIMCKICKEIQSCGIVIANISGLNPNVMLELGLAYGLGKSVIVIKDKKTTNISDLGSIEYIEYAHAGEIQQKLPLILGG